MSLALGSYSSTPLQNAKAFSIIANGGKSIEPYYIEKIVLPNSEVLDFSKTKTLDLRASRLWNGYNEENNEEEIIDPRITYVINDILIEAAKRGTASNIKNYPEMILQEKLEQLMMQRALGLQALIIAS